MVLGHDILTVRQHRSSFCFPIAIATEVVLLKTAPRREPRGSMCRGLPYRLPAVLVGDISPERGAGHHAYKDHLWVETVSVRQLHRAREQEQVRTTVPSPAIPISQHPLRTVQCLRVVL